MSDPPDDTKTTPTKPKLTRLNQNQNARTPLGLHGSGGVRINSFKPPRDLSLGSPPGIKQGGERKKFVPNLNVARTVKKEPNDNIIKHKDSKHEDRKNKGKNKQDKRKERPALIQTMGSVFSEGVGDATGGIRRRPGVGGYTKEDNGGGGGGMEKPKLEMNVKYDKDEEEARLKELLRDDFIDDLTTGGYVPVQLPMVDTGKMFKEKNIKKEEDNEDVIKPSKLSKRPTDLDSDDDDDVDLLDPKPDPDVKPPPISSVAPGPSPDINISDLVKTQKGDLLFIQLPDILPGKVQEGNSCCLGDLEEGCLGKLQIRKSGACQLVLGDNQVLDVEMGTRVGFLEDVVSVRSGEMTVLGHVKHRMVVTPNWDHLLAKSGLNPSLA